MDGPRPAKRQRSSDEDKENDQPRWIYADDPSDLTTLDLTTSDPESTFNNSISQLQDQYSHNMINNSEGPMTNPGAKSLLQQQRDDMRKLQKDVEALKAFAEASKASAEASKASAEASKASADALKASGFLMRYRVMETSFRDGRIPNAPEPLWHLIRAGNSQAHDPSSVFDHGAIRASQTPTRYYGYFQHVYGVHIDRFAAVTAYPQLVELLNHRANLAFQPWHDLSDGAKDLLNDIDHFLSHFSQVDAHILTTTVDGLNIGSLLRRTQTQLQPRPPPLPTPSTAPTTALHTR